METDPEVKALLAQERSRRLRFAAIGLGIAAAVGAGYFALRPTPCQRVADRICRAAPGEVCDSFRAALAQSASPEKCKEALVSLEAAESLPGMLQLNAMALVVQELMGLPPEARQDLDEAARAIAEPLAQLDRTGALTDDAKKALVGAPPAACLLILGKMRGGPPSIQQPLHDVLVGMNGSVDLGPGPEDWAAWCQRRLEKG